MSGGQLAIKIIEPGRLTTADMLDAVLRATSRPPSPGRATPPPAFGVRRARHRAFGPATEDMTSGCSRARQSHPSRGLRQTGRQRHSCGIQGAKGGGWFRSELNTCRRLQGPAPRFAVMPARSWNVSAPPRSRSRRANSSTSSSRAGWTAARCRRRPSMPPGIDKLGLPYYTPGWQQPSAVLDFLMRKDKWGNLAAQPRIQVETACRANIACAAEPLAASPGPAMEKLKARLAVKEWSPELMKVFRAKSEIVLRNRPIAIPISPPRSPTSAPSSARASTGGSCRACLSGHGAAVTPHRPRGAWLGARGVSLLRRRQVLPPPPALHPADGPGRLALHDDPFLAGRHLFRHFQAQRRGVPWSPTSGAAPAKCSLAVARSRASATSRAKLLPRERVRALLDPASPFFFVAAGRPPHVIRQRGRPARASSPASAG